MLHPPPTPLSLLSSGLLLTMLSLSSSAAAGLGVTVSPGEADRAVEIATACPTFSWAAVEGAAGYELAILDLARPEEPAVVLRRTILGAALGWTLGRSECLSAGGTYAWTVRALDANAHPLGGPESWAPPRRFSVPAGPSPADLSAALETLRRWQSTPPAALPGKVPGTLPGSGGEPGKAPGTLRNGELVEASGTSAVRGENPATSGASFGVTGQASSASGAGLVGVNLADGPDLVLDGAAQAEVDAALSQSGIDRPSASAQTFNVRNSGGGGMSLQVDGAPVSLPGHHHGGSDITSGTVAEARIASTLARDSEVMALVLAGDGAGSTLDAVRLDGQEASSAGSINSASNPVHWTKLKGVPGDLADGEDSGIPPRPAFGTQRVDSTDEVGEYASVAIGVDGLPIISYYDRTNGDLKVAHCETLDCATATLTTLDSTGDVGLHTSIGIVGDLPHIAYFDNTELDLKLARCANVSCTSASLTVVDSTGDVGRYASLMNSGANGYPGIAYFDNTASALKFARCTNVSCSTAERTTVDSDGLVGYYASVAPGASGHARIAYYDASTSDLKLAICANASCSSKSIVVVDSDSAVGSHCSIAIGADGLPVIAYREASISYLKVAHCSDSDCSSATFGFASSDGGTYSSVTIGEDGLPLVGFHHPGAGRLGIAHCADQACSSSVVAMGPYVSIHDGEHVSITTGADGFPLVVHHDEDNGDLLVLHCTDRFCTPGVRRR